MNQQLITQEREPRQVLTDIAEQLMALKEMTVGDLRERHVEVFGEPSRSRNKDFLRKKIAWRIQELAEGGLSKRAKARIRELAKDAPARWRRPRGAKALFPFADDGTGPERDPRLPADGTVLTRAYRGVEYEVKVRRDGFEYQGDLYPSLSKIAREITGTNWNGFLFFGLVKRGGNNEDDE